jgi:lysophospholipase L1-like esterase
MPRNTLNWLPAVVALTFACLTCSAGAELKKVLYLGDSITLQHSGFVDQLMDGKADVYRCNQNSTWTGRLLKEALADILNAENCKWDIVWFNVGNWDITPADARFVRKNPDWGFESGKPKTSIPDYEKNLAEIIRRIRAHSPGVKVVISTTTYIPSVGAESVEQFNAAAVKTMKANDVPVFDLYAATKPHVDLLLYKNNTHFSKVANQTVIAPHMAAALETFIKSGRLPDTKTATTLSIPKDTAALEKDRDLGHPKHRGKGKQK